MSDLFNSVVSKVKELTEDQQNVIANRILADLTIIEHNSSTLKMAIAPIKKTKAVIKFVDLVEDAKSNSPYTKPKEDMKFFCLQIVIDNLDGEDSCSSNPNYFKIKDIEGNQYTYCWNSVIEPTLSSDPVEEGDISKGWLTFELPKSQPLENFRIRFDAHGKTSWINFTEIKSALEN